MSATDLRAAAVDAVLDHQWGPLAWSAHRKHNFDSCCAVCSGDVTAVLDVALRAGAIDPGRLRWCEWPGCLASFDAVTGPVGDRGWTRVIGLSLLCPTHTVAGHVPGYTIDQAALSTLPASCSCGAGERVTPANWESVLAWWTAHVLEVS